MPSQLSPQGSSMRILYPTGFIKQFALKIAQPAGFTNLAFWFPERKIIEKSKLHLGPAFCFLDLIHHTDFEAEIFRQLVANRSVNAVAVKDGRFCVEKDL